MGDVPRVRCAEKLNRLPPYLFSAINLLKKIAYEKKLDVIDLGMGNPDLPTPSCIVERMCETISEHPRTHRYPQAKGMPKFRKTVAEWFEQRFGVSLDPEKEVLALIGSKEGVAHLMMAYLNPGEVVLIPNPSYPVYYNATILADGVVYDLPLLPENNYLPDLEKIPLEVLKKAKILVINYPNNPTTAVVENTDFFLKVVAFAKKHNLIVCSDNAYSEITFDGYRAPSFLEVPGAKEVGVEFHSFSKTYNMAGWRLGFVVGNAEILATLEKFKSFLDYGVFTAIQLSGVKALTSAGEDVEKLVEVYRRRRDRVVEGLNKIGWVAKRPKATFYLWLPLPPGFEQMGSLEFAELLLQETGIVVAPGIGFGSYGEGYIRMALVTHDQRFHDLLLRLKKFIRKRSKKSGR